MEQPIQTAGQPAYQATEENRQKAASSGEAQSASQSAPQADRFDAQPSVQAGAQSAFRPIYQPSPKTSGKPSDVWRKAQQRMDALLARHPHAVMYGAIGLAVAVLILAIGLGSTLLLAVLAGIGIAIGQYRDGDSRVRSAANRIMRRFG